MCTSKEYFELKVFLDSLKKEGLDYYMEKGDINKTLIYLREKVDNYYEVS